MRRTTIRSSHWSVTPTKLATRMALLAVRKEGRGSGGGGAPEATRGRAVAAQVSHARRSRPGGNLAQIARRSVSSAACRIAAASMRAA